MSEQTTQGEAKASDINEDEEVVKAEGQEEETLSEEIDHVEEELKEDEEKSYKDKFYYLAAEMENAKRRFEREKVNIIKFGLEKVLKDMLDVVDNFERTVDAAANEEDEKVKNIVEGIQMVRTQFLDVLKKQGLEQVEAMDKEFDPNFHEAMAQQEAEGKEANVVIQEYQKGYILNGRLLRASKVIVSK